MASRDGRHADAAPATSGRARRLHVETVAGSELANVLPSSPRHPPQAVRHDEHRLAADPAQGGKIEVIRVGVRDEHRIDRPDRRGIRGRAEASERPEARAEEWIGQEPDTVHLD